MVEYMHESLTKHSRIAVYLRKSREELTFDEDTLGRHRTQLREYIATYEFKNVEWFEEIGSADSISKRPVFIELLSQIEENRFDAVLVVHYDRLSRGSQIDNGIITQTFKASNTLILTPSRVYDLTDESAELMSEVEGLLSRAEYRSIKRRMTQGKITGTKQGNHVTGEVAYPYQRDKNTGEIYIDEEGRKVANFIAREYLSGNTWTGIARELNRRRVPSPRGMTWTIRQLQRVVTGDVGRGFVTYGDTYVDATGKNRVQTDESKIVKVRGNHEQLFDDETYAKIDRTMLERRGTPPRARKGAYALSGLVKCNICGKGLTVATKRNILLVLKCNNRTHPGCYETKGIVQYALLEKIYEDMTRYRDKLFAVKDVKPKDKVGKSIVEINEEIVRNSSDKVDRLKDMYVDGIIDREEFNSRKEKLDLQLIKAKQEISKYRLDDEYINETLEKEQRTLWKEIDLDELFHGGLTQTKQNRILKSMISKINYERHDNHVGIHIEYK